MNVIDKCRIAVIASSGVGEKRRKKGELTSCVLTFQMGRAAAGRTWH